MKYNAMFFRNGTIAVTDNKGQIPELQRKSVPVLFAEFLESKGYNPTEFLLQFPAGYAILKKGSHGWGSQFENTERG